MSLCVYCWSHGHTEAGGGSQLCEHDKALMPDALKSGEAVRALQEMRRHYESLFEEALEGIVRARLDGTIVAVNPSFTRMVGYESPAELLGKNVKDLYDEPAERERLLRTFAGHDVVDAVEVTWRKRNGDRITVELSGRALRDASEQVVAYQAFVRDVTEVKEQATRERLLLEHKEQLALVIEGTRLGFWDWNPATHSVTFSDRWAKMLGYSRAEIAPHIDTFRALVHPDDLPHIDSLMDAHFAGKVAYFEAVHRMRHQDGRWIYVLSRGKVFERDQAGQPTRFCGTHTDITKEKEAEIAAREANQAKTYFLACMSHELRTPLNAVLGLSEALLDRVYGDLTDKQDRSLQTIHDSGKHLLHLINDVIDIARVEAGKLVVEPADMSLCPLIEECVAFVRDEAAAKQQRLTITCGSAVIIVRADGRRLRQVLLNLLTNAIKFSPRGAVITAGADRLPENGSVELWVADSGPGIPVADRERIFDPFVRLEVSHAQEHRGAGLGLTLVKRIVDLHGGSMRVEGGPGRGSRFVVALPQPQEEVRDGFLDSRG